MNNIPKKSASPIRYVLVLGLALAASSAFAGPATYGPYPYQLHPITTSAQVAALKPGSEVVMTCAKCKTVQIAKTDRKGGILGWFQPKTKHLCPGCGGHMETSTNGVKNGEISYWVHTCSQCGSKSAFCCGPVTKGM